MRGLINHIDLTVSNLETSSLFYDKVLSRLGYKRSLDYLGSIPCWALSTDGPTISIGLHRAVVETLHSRSAVGLHHLAFHATSRSDVDDFHKYLIAEAVTILDAPAVYDYTPGYYAVFFSDPDGIKLELVHEPRFDSSSA